MKKYLLLGLTIIIGTNLAVLAGVAYNRMGDANTQLTLTERELSPPYQSRAQQENSGISLAIKWRALSNKSANQYAYNTKDLIITKDELLALGFQHLDNNINYKFESRELYWALEFDGATHKAEIEEATNAYQTAMAAYEEQPNEHNQREQEQAQKRLAKEKTTNSRLFFLEASADYQSLANKFADQQNILLVKGVAKPSYHNKDKTFSLMLNHLSVSHIMVPLQHSKIFNNLSSANNNDAPRYAVDIKWGKRLEPWIVDARALNE